jgi:hypothetical protein
VEDQPGGDESCYDIREREQQIRQHLTDDDLLRAQRRDEQDLERATLFLSREGDRRHEGGHESQDESDQPGNEEVDALERRVEAHTDPRFDAHCLRAGAEIGLIIVDDCPCVELHRRSRVRVGRVGDEEQPGRKATLEIRSKIRVDDERDIDSPAAKKRLDRLDRWCARNDAKPPCAEEAVAKGNRLGIGRGIDDGQPDVVDVTPQRVPEQDDLDERHQQQDRERLTVAEDVPQLLDHERAK